MRTKKDPFALENLQASAACFSKCRKYRYVLRRVWDVSQPVCVFVGLNPSTADEKVNDPTVRRCMGYAYGWGYGGVVMMNLFALRATDPKVMLAHQDPVGKDNDFYLNLYAKVADATHAAIVCAWGAHGSHRQRSTAVRMLLMPYWPLRCLKKLASGEPGHPLYLKRDLRLIYYP